MKKSVSATANISPPSKKQIKLNSDYDKVFGFVSEGDYDAAREYLLTLDPATVSSIKVALMITHRISL